MYRRDSGYTLPLTPSWRVVCVQLVALLNLGDRSLLFNVTVNIEFVGSGWSDHARHHGTVCARKPAWRVRHVPLLSCTYTSEVGVEVVGLLIEFDLLVAFDATKSYKVGV